MTEGKDPEPIESEPVEAVASEPLPVENGSKVPPPDAVGVIEQVDSTISEVKETAPCLPPPPGKYSNTQSQENACYYLYIKGRLWDMRHMKKVSASVAKII